MVLLDGDVKGRADFLDHVAHVLTAGIVTRRAALRGNLKVVTCGYGTRRRNTWGRPGDWLFYENSRKNENITKMNGCCASMLIKPLDNVMVYGLWGLKGLFSNRPSSKKLTLPIWPLIFGRKCFWGRPTSEWFQGAENQKSYMKKTAYHTKYDK